MNNTPPGRRAPSSRGRRAQSSRGRRAQSSRDPITETQHLLDEHAELTQHLQALSAERNRLLRQAAGIRAKLAHRLPDLAQDPAQRAAVIDILQQYEVSL